MFLARAGAGAVALGLGGLGVAGSFGRATAAAQQTFTFVNNAGQPIWIGALGNPGKEHPRNGGWKMEPGESTDISLPGDWAGRFWGRTGCSFDGSGTGRCETGDCGGKLECAGAGGEPPVSLAEITLGNGAASDFYDVSFVDGSNLPVTMEPLGGNTDPNDPYRCTKAGCTTDLNPECPDELRHKNADGKTVGCKSACLRFNTDHYCCRGAHGTPETCKPAEWPVNYAAYFKERCPQAYSYAYDDKTSTFTCQNTGYRITFGG